MAFQIKEMVDDSVGVVRNMELLLRPSMLDDLGLVPALQWQAREVSKLRHLGSTFSVESQSGTGPILCIVLPLAKAVEDQLSDSHERHTNSIS